MIIGLYFINLLQMIIIAAKFIYDRRKDKRIESFLNCKPRNFEESEKIDKNFNELEVIEKELRDIKTLTSRSLYEKVDDVLFLVKIFGSNYSIDTAHKTINEIKRMIKEDLHE